MPSEDKTKPEECFAVLKSIHRVKIEKEVNNLKDIKDIYAKNARKTPPVKANQGPFFFI